jgi:flavodoxin
MRAVIVYESMFGNTHAIADAVGKGLEPMLEVVVVPLAEAGRERLGDADLLVVGGPTHFHGMSRPSSRKWAAGIAQNPATIWCSIATPRAQACVTGSRRWATAA